MFDREIKLIGEHNFQKIANKTVALIGIGGVGGYVFENLVRCGIQKLIIIDYDTIDITNLNRQILTTQNNIEKKKVVAAKERALSINPDINIITLDLFLTEENKEKLWQYNMDYIIDACDAINTKKMLIKEATNRNIPIISCMGTGNKLHPELLQITELNKTSYDPIAKILRKYIKTEKINKKIMVVCSKEEPLKTKTKEITSISYVPAAAGILLASYVINDIIKNS